MQVIRDIKHVMPQWQGCVLALGNFDGVHRGHEALLMECKVLAKAKGTKAAVMTFAPHPRDYFSVNKQPVSIYSFAQKAKRLEALGIDCVFVARFNAVLANMTAHAFVHSILYEALRVRHVLTGGNFAFGKGREGNTEFLVEKATQFGFGYTVVPAVCDGGKVISTSAIREALQRGDVAEASHMLAQPYSLEGHVIHGHKRGGQIGFPTANIRLHHLYPPRFGVYAVRVKIKDSWFDGVANVGVKPTFGDERPLLEVHVFDFSDVLYGEKIKVKFLQFIRPEQKFSNIDDLRAQIARDVAQVKNIKEKA